VRQGECAAGFEAFYPLPAVQALGPTTAVRLQRYAQEAALLAEQACRALFADASLDTGEITHLVTVSCTGMVSPGIDAELIPRLGLCADIGRINLGFMGCHGALNGLRAASGLAQENPEARVLLCCVELCSLHFQYGWDPQKIVANSLFGDGAGAVVVGLATAATDANPGDARQAPRWQLRDFQSCLVPESGDAMTWRVGDHGFEMTLSSEVPKLIRGSLHAWLSAWLARHEMRVSDVSHWAIHPGGPDILRAVTQALALPETASRTSAEILAEHGNMSSPTVLFVLERLKRQGATGPCVMLGFGPGLTFEAALLV
jgi:predicted naringenin-chalcone synthase